MTAMAWVELGADVRFDSDEHWAPADDFIVSRRRGG